MKFLIKVLIAAGVAYGLAFSMTVVQNQETRFWRAVGERRDKEITEARVANPGKPFIFFAGGSSCAFSVDPAVIEEKCGLPSFNLGYPIACGPRFIYHKALEKTRPGDVLVVALEPDMVTYPSDLAPGTLSFGLATLSGSPSASVGGKSFDSSLSLRDYLNLSRPGPSHVAVWFGKTATGKGYRYQKEDMRYHGRVETQVTMEVPEKSGLKDVTEVTEEGRKFLQTLSSKAKEKGVRLVYSMPWLLTSDEAATASRDNNRLILKSISSTIPTIDDGHLGVATDPAYFADTGLHLSASGSKIRSSDLGNVLRDWLAANPK